VPNGAALINKIINEEPPDIWTLNRNVPTRLSKIIIEVTANDKDVRYKEIGASSSAAIIMTGFGVFLAFATGYVNCSTAMHMLDISRLVA